MRKNVTERAWGRWGLLISAVMLGAALMMASWWNHRAARAASMALNEGQARVFERAIIGALHRYGDLEQAQDYQVAADSLLADYRSEGLRYVALMGPDNSVAASAGTALGALDTLPLAGLGGGEPGYQLTAAGERLRVSILPPRFASSRPDAAFTMPRGVVPDHRGAGGGPPWRSPLPRGIVFEFEPLIAAQLVERARNLMLFGVASAVIMLVVAGLSWRVSRGYESAMMRLEEQRRLSLLGEMSAVLAHEIRNPLASLMGHAQLLVEALPAGTLERSKAEVVVREATRLDKMTNDLLDFVRTGPSDRAPVDPVALVRSAIEEVDAGGFTVRVERAPGLFPLDVDRVRQVLVNLLRNSQQSTPAGALPPVVTVSSAGSDLVMEVRDHGPGLPAGHGERIFAPFFTTRATGTGLGLAVARRIVEHHGGTLSAADHPEGGAVFRVRLPGA